MTFPVALALGLSTLGAVLAISWLAPSAVALSALGLWLALTARKKAKFMNEPLRMSTLAITLNLLSLGLGAVAVAQFGATFLWIWRAEAPQIRDFRTAFGAAIAPLPDLGSSGRDLAGRGK